MTNKQNTINFTPALRDALRSAYEVSVEKKQDTFNWHGNAYVTSYAKYLLEHLDNQFGEAA